MSLKEYLGLPRDRIQTLKRIITVTTLKVTEILTLKNVHYVVSVIFPRTHI